MESPMHATLIGAARVNDMLRARAEMPRRN